MDISRFDHFQGKIYSKANRSNLDGFDIAGRYAAAAGQRDPYVKASVYLY